MSIPTSKPPVWFWIVCVLALLWNLLGVSAYIMQSLMSEADYALLSDAERAMYANLPVWYMLIFAIAVFSGTIASIALLIKKRWAYVLFILSLLAVGIQQFYILTVVKPEDIIMSLLISIVAVFLVWFSKLSIAKKWIV